MDRLLRVLFGLTVMLAAAQGQNTLNETVNRNGCGTSKACFASPLECDPATLATCLLATSKTSGDNLKFELRGEATGYVALALSTDTTPGGNDKTYICTKNSTFTFALLDNGNLTVSNETGITGNASFLVQNGTINCAFEVSGLNASSSRNAATTFAVVLVKGALNSDGSLGTPSIESTSGLVDLTNPASSNSNSTANATTTATTITTTTAAATITTAVGTTASGANINLQHTLSQAALILFGVLALGLM